MSVTKSAERRWARRRFRTKIVLFVIGWGLLALWTAFYLTARDQQSDTITFITGLILQQTQSTADLISRIHSENIAQLKAQSDDINARLIQNENNLSENDLYSGTIPNISVQNMSEAAFMRMRDALIDAQESLAFSARLYPNRATSEIFPEYGYIFDQPATVTTPNVVRILADSHYSATHDNRRLWLGLFVRGSSDVAYDRIVQGNIISGQIPGFTTRYYAGSPIYDVNGEAVIGALVFEYDVVNNLLVGRSQTVSTAIRYIIASIIYIALVVVMMTLLLRPLKKLVRSAARIQADDYKNRAFLKKNDELGLIGDSIDKITEKIESTLYDIEFINRTHNGLFPSEYLEFLDKKSVSELEVGEHTERYVSILVISISCPEVLEHGFYSSVDLVELMNDTVQFVGDVLNRSVGFIETFNSDELLLFFPYDADIALDTAKDIQRKTTSWNEKRAQNDKPKVSFNMALHRGTASMCQCNGSGS